MPKASKRAIVVLAGGFSRGADGNWHSSPFGQLADVSISGSYVRIIATYLLWRQNQSAMIVTSGGRAEGDKVFPPGLSTSLIMKEELKELGIPETVILEKDQSGNTYQQLCAIASMAIEHRWLEVGIVSSRFHLPRVQAMVECLDELEALKAIVKYVSAEDVVLAVEPDKWRKQIEDAYRSPEFAEIIVGEECGTAQVRAGTYRLL